MSLISANDRLLLPPVEVPVEPRTLVRARARSRARLLGAVMAMGLVAIAARGAQLCAAPSERVARAGAVQRYDQVVLTARRGDVVDRNGRRLATSVDTPAVAVDPSLVDPAEIDALAGRLADLLSLPRDEVKEKLGRTSRYAKLASRVHPQVAAQIEDLDHPAVWTHPESRRYYPEETLGAQLIGFVDAGGAGRAGLEEALDRYLRGGSVVVQRRRDRKGLDVDRPAGVDLAANQGMDVHLTIDRTIQRVVERELQEIVDKSAPVSASAIVVDVRTGDVLAMGNVPTFNPNAVGTDPEPRKNHLVADAIEPGSVFKPFTIAAAIEEGLVTPETKIDCEGGSWAIGRARIGDDHPHGVVTISEVMKYSSNIGSAKLAFKVGAPRFLEYVERFGFGERTGIPLPGERRGRVRAADKIKPIELATTAFGQGMTATPLQVAMATATIANGGVRMQPRLVTRIEDVHGVPEYVQKPQAVGRVVSETTARQVAEMMMTVTDDGGTGTRARVKGYKVAGKTGTAQKVKDGHYSEARIGSFVGFVPADRPALAIVVVVDEPTIGSRYGGIVAAPAFADIAAESLRYLGVPPDPEPVSLDPAAPPPAPAPAPEAALPAAAEPAPVALARAGDGWTMPDLVGRSLREVLVGFENAGLHLEIQGSGRVSAQKPLPGELVSPGGTVSVLLR